MNGIAKQEYVYVPFRKGKKRKLGRPKSVPGAKRVKTSPDSSDTSKQNYDGYIGNTHIFYSSHPPFIDLDI